MANVSTSYFAVTVWFCTWSVPVTHYSRRTVCDSVLFMNLPFMWMLQYLVKGGAVVEGAKAVVGLFNV